MKKITEYISVALLMLGLMSCSSKEPVQKPEVYPRIYTNSWTATMSATKGTEFVISPLVSPAGQSVILWTLDDIVIGREAELRWIPDTLGTFTLTLSVEYNTHKTLRTTLLTVKEAPTVPVDPDDPDNPDGPDNPDNPDNPDDPDVPVTPFDPDPFVPKTMGATVVGFFDAAEGDTTKINWGAISHLIVTTAAYNTTGTVDYPYSIDGMRSLVNTAHHHGVYIMLQYSGEHNHTTSVQKYGTTNFYGVATDPAAGAKAVTDMVAYANSNGLDGIHIWMDKPTSSNDGYADVNALREFYSSLHAAKPEQSATGGKFFMSIGTIPSQFVTKGVQDLLIPLPGWDFIFTMVMCIEATSNTSHAPQDVLKSELSYWQNLGVPKAKLVVTIPALAWCVDASSVGGKSNLTYNNISSCSSYVKFKDLPDLTGKTVAEITATNNFTNIAGYDWIRYDGFPWINTKIKYLNDPGAGAMAVWKVDYDGEGDLSMLNFIKTTIGY